LKATIRRVDTFQPLVTSILIAATTLLMKESKANVFVIQKTTTNRQIRSPSSSTIINVAFNITHKQTFLKHGYNLGGVFLK